jgi:hypothetical protein
MGLMIVFYVGRIAPIDAASRIEKVTPLLLFLEAPSDLLRPERCAFTLQILETRRWRAVPDR